MGSVELHVDQHAIDQLMRVDGPVAKWVTGLARPVLQAAIDGCPEDTGQLKSSLGQQMVKTGFALEAWVGVRTDRNGRTESGTTNAEVALHQEFGAPAANVPATHWLSAALKMAHS